MHAALVMLREARRRRNGDGGGCRNHVEVDGVVVERRLALVLGAGLRCSSRANESTEQSLLWT